MESRKMAAFLSILISQILLLLLLPPSPLSLSSSIDPNNNSITPLLSLHEIAASLSLLPFSRKRKRKRSPSPEPPPSDTHRHPVPTRDLDSFVGFFKMTSSTFEWLTGLLEPLLDCRDPVGSPLTLSAELRLGIGLFRLVTGSDYSEISRRFRVPVAASRFCTKQLCRVLCTNFRFWVGFPNPNELDPISKKFESISGLPNCCGAIQCVRFKHSSSNRGESDSIAVQVVSDSSCRILSIVAGFNGKKSDSLVLKQSSLSTDIEQKKLLKVNQYIVGSQSYPLLPWLMVPYEVSVPGSSEEHFNSVHDSMMFPVIRTVSSLQKWGILERPLEEENLKAAVACIGACSILHNAMLIREDYSALSDGSRREMNSNLGNMESGDSSLFAGCDHERASVMRDALASLVKEEHDSSNSLSLSRGS